MKKNKNSGLLYRGFKAYIRFIHETLLIRRRYTIGLDHLPKEGERYFIVCNHQNTAEDPFNILFSLPMHYCVCAMARANVFFVHPLITRFLHWIGLVPAFRFGWEGGEGLEQNFDSFEQVAKKVNAGMPLIVFPEAGHTQGHYLDRFTTGSVRMAFHAAKFNNWKEDIKIVPSAHHYSDYFDVQTEFLWMVSEPISLKPYYGRFQEHPNSVMREITRELHGRIRSMMLDEGIENYEQKDYLRCSALNPASLEKLPLPEHLEADKQFVKKLLENPDYQEIIGLTEELRKQEKALGVSDLTISEKPGWIQTVCRILLLVVLLPLWLVSLWPHAICYVFPPKLIKSDRMFVNSYRYVVSALVIYPLSALLTVLVMGLGWGLWWQALVWVLVWVLLGRFCWWYYQQLRKCVQAVCYLCSPKKVREIEHVRANIREKLKV